MADASRALAGFRTDRCYTARQGSTKDCWPAVSPHAHAHPRLWCLVGGKSPWDRHAVIVSELTQILIVFVGWDVLLSMLLLYAREPHAESSQHEFLTTDPYPPSRVEQARGSAMHG